MKLLYCSLQFFKSAYVRSLNESLQLTFHYLVNSVNEYLQHSTLIGCAWSKAYYQYWLITFPVTWTTRKIQFILKVATQLVTMFLKRIEFRRVINGSRDGTRHKSSMIHSARPTVLAGNDFCLIFDLQTDRQTDLQTPRVKIATTTDRDCGSASWINKIGWYPLEIAYSFVPTLSTILHNNVISSH